MIKVGSSQFNFKYGTSIHYPYSIACLVSYIQSLPHLKRSFDFKKTFVYRPFYNEYLSTVGSLDILLCSCYVWNWEITTKLAKEAKRKNPNLLIILGGPQVPDKPSQEFFKTHNYIDLLVHKEGELTLKLIFEAYIGKKSFNTIPGVSSKNVLGRGSSRIKDLTVLPSPYLTDTVLKLTAPIKNVNYIASWETNRGCPFECTFCDWGSATHQKINKFDMERLLAEIEWFSDHKLSYIDCCDANFGIFADRDLELATKLSRIKLKTGYPKRIRPAWTKTSSTKIIPIALQLLKSDLLRAVTLAVQSLDVTTLKSIKRRNIPFNSFSELVQEFRKENIETYTELIIGLPGETLASYKQSLNELMELEIRPMVYVYNCGVFENAPMNNAKYKSKYEIQTIRSPIYLWHSSKNNRGDVQEYEDIVIQTSTFSTEDLEQMFLYSWTVQAFHSLGIFEYIARYYYIKHKVSFIDFYDIFILFSKACPSTMFGKEYTRAAQYAQKGYRGLGWNHYDKALGDIFWPMEEATWLRTTSDLIELQSNIKKFLKYLNGALNIEVTSKVLGDLVLFQIFLLSNRQQKNVKMKCTHDWPKFYGEGVLIEKTQTYIKNNKVSATSTYEWNYQAMWLGRSQGNYKTFLNEVRVCS